MDQKKLPLTSPEIANLWTQFMNDSTAICIISHSLEYVKDPEVRDILEFSFRLSEKHIGRIKEFFQEDQLPIPIGFTKEDVNYDAPPLFSDVLILVYIYIMTLHGLSGYAGALGNTVRADQRRYFMECNNDAMELYDKCVSVMLEKGIFSKPPNINSGQQVEFVNHQNYLAGWFGKRPLNVIEMTGLYYNIKKTILKIALELGFSQVAKKKDVRDYFLRGAELCKKHLDILETIMTKENLPTPIRWESEVSASTDAPFSEKLMLNLVVYLVSASLGFYGAGLAVCQRRDLSVQYAALIIEIGRYAEDGANLLIKHGWMEQPLLATDREELARKNE